MGDSSGFWRAGIMTPGRRLLSAARRIGVLACVLLMAWVLGYGTVSLIPIVLYHRSEDSLADSGLLALAVILGWSVMMLAVWLVGAALLAARRRRRLLVVWTGVCWAALVGYPLTLLALWDQDAPTAAMLAIIVALVVAGVARACLRPSALGTGLCLALALLIAAEGYWDNWGPLVD
jgi:hypothetical protein